MREIGEMERAGTDGTGSITYQHSVGLAALFRRAATPLCHIFFLSSLGLSYLSADSVAREAGGRERRHWRELRPGG